MLLVTRMQFCLSCLSICCSWIVSIMSVQALVWDDALTGPVGLIAEYTLLKVVYI